MSLEKVIKFDNITTIYPTINLKKNPLLIKEFTIKSNKKMYFNIIINEFYLIYFQDDNYFINDKEHDNFIQSEYNNIDGYYNNFKFDTYIYIERIQIRTINSDYDVVPQIYFEYDSDHIETDVKELEHQYIDSYFFKRKYFKFFNLLNNDIELIKIFNIQIEYKDNKRTYIEIPYDESMYKFKYLKDNTYYVEFNEEQSKKKDYYYIFNNTNYISSYFSII
jgi:hypothetical protein